VAFKNQMNPQEICQKIRQQDRLKILL